VIRIPCSAGPISKMPTFPSECIFDVSKLLKTVYLSAQEIFLKSLECDDVTQDYVDWMNDAEVVQFTESRFQKHTLESVKKFVEDSNSNPSVLLLGIFESGNGIHIGNIKLGPINWQHSLADVGIIIGQKEFWGKGLASVAIKLLRDHAFESIGLHKLTAGCYATNLGSAKAFEKAGFQLEARMVSQYRSGDSWVGGLLFGFINPAG
jgi:ribosomal-protein-alanine N-acetyltransferase